jgi:hypothetical protein
MGYLQMDGEPWQQPLCQSDQPATILQIEQNLAPFSMLRAHRKYK